MVEEGELTGFEVVDATLDLRVNALPQLLITLTQPPPTPHHILKLLQRRILSLPLCRRFEHIEQSLVIKLKVIR